MNAARKSVTIADLRMEMVAKIAAVLGLAVVVFAFAYSFFQIKWVSDQIGVDHAWLSYFFPFIIDLPSVVASALTVALHDREFKVRSYAWSILIVFTSLSWMCNAIHAVEKAAIPDLIPGPWGIILTVLISGIPPFGVVLGMHLWAYALRHSAGADQRAEAPAVVKKAAANPAETTETKTKPPKPEATPEEPEAAPLETVDEEQLVRAEFAVQVEALEPGADLDTIKASDIGKTVGTTVSAATVRRWVGKCKIDHLAAQAADTAEPAEEPAPNPRHAAQEPAEEVTETRERETVSAA